jgi:hypothetical protein
LCFLTFYLLITAYVVTTNLKAYTDYCLLECDVMEEYIASIFRGKPFFTLKVEYVHSSESTTSEDVTSHKTLIFKVRELPTSNNKP